MTDPLSLGLFALMVSAGIAAALMGRHLVAGGRKPMGWIALALAVALIALGAAGLFRALAPAESGAPKITRSRLG